jgi:hypothetical protein
VGSYEPGEGWERVGGGGAWIVSVVDLMGRKGVVRPSRNLRAWGRDCRLGPIGRRKRSHPGHGGNEDPPVLAGRPGEGKGGGCTGR